MRGREQNIFDGNGNAGMGTTFSFTGMGTGNGNREKSFPQDTKFYSLSRREESSKNKLSACLRVCPHFTDCSKNNLNRKVLSCIKLGQGNQGRGVRI
jgi:hypothetical protein